ncbi:MAG TPA: hypothetical protein VEX86_22815 [Longimicrobium sp.]|nr:hypothetical protein [Longimicrobium sp.]
MKISVALLAIIGAALAAFGWWGVYTRAGMRRYDEMDGIIPAAAYYFGLLLLALAVVVALFAWWRASRRAAAAG